MAERYALINPRTNNIVKYPYDYRKGHKNTSFPPFPSDAQLASFNVVRVHEPAKPVISANEIAERKPEPVLRRGDWIRDWIVRPKTREELDKEQEQRENRIVNTKEAKLFMKLLEEIRGKRITRAEFLEWYNNA